MNKKKMLVWLVVAITVVVAITMLVYTNLRKQYGTFNYDNVATPPVLNVEE